MKPIKSEYSVEVVNALAKAQRLLEKAEKLNDVSREEMSRDMPTTLPNSMGTPRKTKRGKGEEQATNRPGMRETGQFPLPNTGDDIQRSAKCDCKEGECNCKDCPKCGSKMNKMGGCMKMGCGGKMEKAEPGLQHHFQLQPSRCHVRR